MTVEASWIEAGVEHDWRLVRVARFLQWRTTEPDAGIHADE